MIRFEADDDQLRPRLHPNPGWRGQVQVTWYRTLLCGCHDAARLCTVRCAWLLGVAVQRLQSRGRQRTMTIESVTEQQEALRTCSPAASWIPGPAILSTDDQSEIQPRLWVWSTRYQYRYSLSFLLSHVALFGPGCHPRLPKGLCGGLANPTNQVDGPVQFL